MTADQSAAASAGAQIRVTGSLPADDAAGVLDLVREAASADRVSPLSEHVMLQLRYGADQHARNIRIWHQGKLAGYGHVDLAGPGEAEGASAEMVVRPAARRRGLGLTLGRALLAETGDGPLRVWAHGDLPAASALAAAAGFRRSRGLWQLRRPLSPPLADPKLPAGVLVRTFRVGQDEDAWLAVNRRAFATHPEQGAWTRADIEVREREPWFDPDGFFLAERDGRLAGFHWTKVHRGEADAEAAAVGEVYVLGVDPAEQGTGLGRALTLIGLRYLRARDLPEVMLYAEETNVAAIGLYQSLGFTHTATDVMYTGSNADASRG
ncbi:MAG: mycothiol synthase [Actinobacteria bacterium]|nr:mycothiol synthase [Actinomycetota bacterium]